MISNLKAKFAPFGKKLTPLKAKLSSYYQKLPSAAKTKRGLLGGLLILSLPITLVLVQNIQDLRQRASEPVTPATPPNPPPNTYFLETAPSSTVEMVISAPNTGYGINVYLRDSQGYVINPPYDLSYTWTVSDPSVIYLNVSAECFNGVQPPCPNVHGLIQGLKEGKSNIDVVVTKKTDGSKIASATFNITVSNSTPSTTPTPTGINPSPTKYPSPTKKPTPTKKPSPTNKPVTPTPTPSFSCDLNGDKKVTAADYSFLLSCNRNNRSTSCTRADLNKDGKVNESDLNIYNRSCAKQIR